MTPVTPSTNNGQTVDRLYELLPISYRQRDMAEGSPLQMLLRVIAEQVNLVEQDIAQLYDNWFIETCQDWVVPYIADLIGYQPVTPPNSEDSTSSALEAVMTPRREVANTLRNRRRKGTLSLLQELANAVSGWPAQVVEFDHHVNATQSLDHLHLQRGRFADLRDIAGLDRLGSALDPLGHSVELRQVDSPIAPGRYNTAAVATLIGRLRAFPVTHSLAACQQEAGDQCYTFSILGDDVPLYSSPGVASQEQGKDTAAFPVPISRVALRHQPEAEANAPVHASTHFYGEDKGFAIWAKGWSDCDSKLPIPASRIIPADLTDWRYRPKQNHIALDPELGRIAFPLEQLPPKDVFVSYHYGAAAAIGGGEYSRPHLNSTRGATLYEVGAGLEFPTIHSACERWHEDKPRRAIIEIADSAVYEGQIHLTISAKQSLELRAANGARPVILIPEWHASRPDALSVVGGEHSHFTLDGILIAGRGIQVSGALETLTLRDCTLVPGWSLHPDGKARKSGEPSLALENLTAIVTISNSILGGIHVMQEREDVDPLELDVRNSIIDSAHPHGSALTAPDDYIAWAVAHFCNCTILGKVQTHSIALAQNTLFLGEVRIARRQLGCIRFCYVSPGSRTPRRYHCQPDLAEQAVMQEAGVEELDKERSKLLRRNELLRVAPQLMSQRYGTPDYCRLEDDCAPEILKGADDRSEIGVFHNLYQPQRISNLNARIQEYVPAGVTAGIIFVT